jgi:hypothetical protein
MMRAVPLALLLLAACTPASYRTVRASAPAPDGVLACVEAAARERGYAPVRGDQPDTQLRLVRDLTGPMRETQRTWLAIDAVVDGTGTLRLFGERWEQRLLSGDPRGRKLVPGETVRADVREVARRCGSAA